MGSTRMEWVPIMAKRSLSLLMFFVVSVVAAAVLPWDKAPEQWTLADVFRILQNSPWSPSKFSLESNYRQRSTNPQSGVVDDSPVNGRNLALVPGITLTRAHPEPGVTGLWS